MGRLKVFEINLSNSAGVFYAGQVVEGHVLVELTEPMQLREVKLNFDGVARVDWSETDSSNNRTSYSASEKYFTKDELLFGKTDISEGDFSELSNGRHVWPFQFQLPFGLPCSFEGPCGYVRYIITCKINRPMKFDHKIKKIFTILSTLDLNLNPSNMKRVQDSKQKQLCCLWCKSDPISASFHIERQGFVPGEAIKLFAEICNGSNRKISKSFVELRMVTTYRATTSTTLSSRVIASISRPEIPAHSEDIWSGEELIIPSVPPSFLEGCNIIDIRYFVQLNVDPAGPALDLEIPLEVVIGTIPLMSVVKQNPPMAPVAFNDALSWPLPPPSKPGSAQIFPDLAPPSYNECITGRVNIKDKEDEYTRGDFVFAPAYTYYNWGHASALPE
ncbi:arrestin domain-containing protein 3 [Plakobranchus ocellatus]|uniref:Arrestin domain-containing protein 3 n=1 Tax=Plakobranchus ocellatus TaxID=259542 RepID=A0AAV4CYT6_9GAST|nr:arrestin domain-containing protein 3 [Plakobranchus ocellatus]